MTQGSNITAGSQLASGTRIAGHKTRPAERTTLRAALTALFLLIGLLALAIFPGCVKVEETTGCTASGEFCTGPDISNARIEIASQPSLRPTDTLWISAKTNSPSNNALDQLAVRWDSYILHINNNGTFCTQQMCSLGASTCHAVFEVIGGIDVPKVQSCEGFMLCASPTDVPTTYSGYGFASGCPCDPASAACSPGGSIPGESPPVFTATSNTTYQVLAPAISSRKEVLATKKVFVVGSTPQQSTYQANIYTESNNPTYRWFTTWQPPVGSSLSADATRVDNFSSNLQVSRVRILKGRCQLDSGGKCMRDPAKGVITLDDAVPVRPSSILLVPNFDPNRSSVLRQNRFRCYSDTSPDGNIDLTNCRSGSLPAGGATPTYFKAQPADMLNWFAEFNPGETVTAGATAPTLASNEVLVIEFTIQES